MTDETMTNDLTIALGELANELARLDIATPGTPHAPELAFAALIDHAKHAAARSVYTWLMLRAAQHAAAERDQKGNPAQ